MKVKIIEEQMNRRHRDPSLAIGNDLPEIVSSKDLSKKLWVGHKLFLTVKDDPLSEDTI